MGKIRTKQFQLLTDVHMAWDFMVEIYNMVQEGGPGSAPAPFFEYALTSSWMNKDYLHLCRFWLQGDTVVGFVFYENAAEIHFILRPGYEQLADEMIQYASGAFTNWAGELKLVFSDAQKALMEAAEREGYTLERSDTEYMLDFSRATLNYALPEGFHFVDPSDVDPLKLTRCTWKSFNEWEFGAFENWDIADNKSCWTPYKAYLGVLSCFMAPPPHATYEFNVIIADENEEYACYSGMWWVAENGLAYMEPLCTIPEYRHKGLAAAALTKHFQRFKDMGGKIMTGGGNDFYKKIGYDKVKYTRIYSKNRHTLA